MWRTLRAFSWMRWRVLMNSIERTSARDTLERLSLALEQIGPVIAFALLVPSAAILAGLGAYAGYWVTTGGFVVTFEAIRILLLIASGFCLIGPLMMPSIERTNAIRLLLLPIPRRTLYVAQAVAAVNDPWILLAIPTLLAMPIGIAAGGAFRGSLFAVAAATLLILSLIGLSAIASTLLHLVVRDRRRGELATMIVVLLIPVLSVLPGVLAARDAQARHQTGRRSERRVDPETGAPGNVTAAERAFAAVKGSYRALPSELFTRAVRSSARADARTAGLAILGLAGFVVAFHGAGMLLFGRLLDAPGSTTRSRARSSNTLWRLPIPGLSNAAAAVAQSTFLLALRTPRGRSTLLSPIVVFTMLAIMARQTGGVDFGPLDLKNGLGLGTFGSAVCLLSILPFSMNQFAIDRSGLTMELLAPLETRALLAGKEVGLGLIIAGPVMMCVVLAYAILPGGPLALWISLPLGLLAAYLTSAPAAAALSALFPKPVDLNSIGNRSNAHGIAGTIGLFVFGFAGLPPVLIVFLSTTLLHRPILAPALMLAWCAIVFVVTRLLFRAVAVVFDRRRENLGLVV